MGAVEARERVHFIGFVEEKKFAVGGFGEGNRFVANPHLFKNEADVNEAIGAWPLRRATVLNTSNSAS